MVRWIRQLSDLFYWTKRPLKKEKKKDKIMVEKEQIFYKSQVVLVRKLANLTQT